MTKGKQSIESAVEKLNTQGKAAKAASHRLAFISTDIKNKALNNIAEDLLSRKDQILKANKKDMAAAKASGMNEAMLERLLLN